MDNLNNKPSLKNFDGWQSMIRELEGHYKFGNDAVSQSALISRRAKEMCDRVFAEMQSDLMDMEEIKKEVIRIIEEELNEVKGSGSNEKISLAGDIMTGDKTRQVTEHIMEIFEKAKEQIRENADLALGGIQDNFNESMDKTRSLVREKENYGKDSSKELERINQDFEVALEEQMRLYEEKRETIFGRLKEDVLDFALNVVKVSDRKFLGKIGDVFDAFKARREDLRMEQVNQSLTGKGERTTFDQSELGQRVQEESTKRQAQELEKYLNKQQDKARKDAEKLEKRYHGVNLTLGSDSMINGTETVKVTHMEGSYTAEDTLARKNAMDEARANYPEVYDSLVTELNKANFDKTVFSMEVVSYQNIDTGRDYMGVSVGTANGSSFIALYDAQSGELTNVLAKNPSGKYMEALNVQTGFVQEHIFAGSLGTAFHKFQSITEAKEKIEREKENGNAKTISSPEIEKDSEDKDSRME